MAHLAQKAGFMPFLEEIFGIFESKGWTIYICKHNILVYKYTQLAALMTPIVYTCKRQSRNYICNFTLVIGTLELHL